MIDHTNISRVICLTWVSLFILVCCWLVYEETDFPRFNNFVQIRSVSAPLDLEHLVLLLSQWHCGMHWAVPSARFTVNLDDSSVTRPLVSLQRVILPDSQQIFFIIGLAVWEVFTSLTYRPPSLTFSSLCDWKHYNHCGLFILGGIFLTSSNFISI